ncbi:hypothetical protein N7455_011864 [Penicillium solitum]|uniref:uncharacterized protein n=1 Tax=Penicillium solitum TaxID=60172 RepID=UPI0032C43BC8|nr:hypothetical protein N7455_011864 [Penicillium solitum]
MEGSQDTQPVLSPRRTRPTSTGGSPPIYLVEGKWADKNPWEDESVPNNAIKWGEAVCVSPVRQ